MVAMKLQTRDVTIRLSEDDVRWCRVDLDCGSRCESLGADSKKIVVERLLAGLGDNLSGNNAGEIDGHSVRWVASFSERHCSIYACNVGEVRHLFFQAASGELLSRTTLEPHERQEWARALEAWGQES